MIIRIADICISFIGIILLSPLILLLIIFGWIDTSSPFFFQNRVGLNKSTFLLIKFRTMRQNTLSIDTHLVDQNAITSYGKLLRLTKLDEIPQLWNVFKGDMSIVGPRPSLLSQKELIYERQKLDIFLVKPGITGLAQIKGIDMSEPVILAKTDLKMISKMNLFYYFYYILFTILLIFSKRN